MNTTRCNIGYFKVRFGLKQTVNNRPNRRQAATAHGAIFGADPHLFTWKKKRFFTRPFLTVYEIPTAFRLAFRGEVLRTGRRHSTKAIGIRSEHAEIVETTFAKIDSRSIIIATGSQERTCAGGKQMWELTRIVLSIDVIRHVMKFSDHNLEGMH